MTTAPPTKPDLNMPLLFVVWFAAAMLLLVVVLLVHAFYLATEESQSAQYQNAPVLSLDELRNQQQSNLNTPRWIDRDKQLIAIPIEQAMNIMVQTQGRFPTTQPR